MKKFSVLLKVAVLSLLAAPIAFAASESVASSSYAEPVVLTLCGAIMLVFGMLKSKKTEA